MGTTREALLATLGVFLLLLSSVAHPALHAHGQPHHLDAEGLAAEEGGDDAHHEHLEELHGEDDCLLCSTPRTEPATAAPAVRRPAPSPVASRSPRERTPDNAAPLVRGPRGPPCVV